MVRHRRVRLTGDLPLSWWLVWGLLKKRVVLGNMAIVGQSLVWGRVAVVRWCALALLGLAAWGNAASICVEFKADDAYLSDGLPGDLDYSDKKLVKLESRGGRSQMIYCSGKWRLSRKARVEAIQALQVPIKLSSETEDLEVMITIYSVKTKGWHPILTTRPSAAGDQHAPVIRKWQDYYDPETREIRFALRARKGGLTPVKLELDTLSIRPVWQLQSVSHEIAERVAGGDERMLKEHRLDRKSLQPSLEMQRPTLQPGERFRQTGGAGVAREGEGENGGGE